MIAPTAIGSIIAKSTVTQVLRWFGYRKTLVGITVFIGLMIAQFSLAVARDAAVDASSAAVRAGDGDVHAVYRHEYHYPGRF
ncbi:major facilitator superfamily permease [Klebsiella pneumoniae]|uniref:Major facilitator superfamily permease n=1 Tax=Klebsiella pneumoniae TaxID=573 RepID=A0A377W9I0_KLEPN|nr:major facilitator superfamily permease [Klebsiella pneumoniae]